ncbi:MAG: hypothetical protein BJ554DRAFT_7814, partial [Olpidium bornovanus]
LVNAAAPRDLGDWVVETFNTGQRFALVTRGLSTPVHLSTATASITASIIYVLNLETYSEPLNVQCYEPNATPLTAAAAAHRPPPPSSLRPLITAAAAIAAAAHLRRRRQRKRQDAI